jgi:hypothetical protein
MREKPWIAIDLLTDETVGWYHNEVEAWTENAGKPVTVLYRPGRKGKAKR